MARATPEWGGMFSNSSRWWVIPVAYLPVMAFLGVLQRERDWTMWLCLLAPALPWLLVGLLEAWLRRRRSGIPDSVLEAVSERLSDGMSLPRVDAAPGVPDDRVQGGRDIISES
jgi:hypothetical protein